MKITVIVIITTYSFLHLLLFSQRTGTPLRAQARLQINIAVPYVPEVYPAAKLREMIFPVMWFEDVCIDEYLALPS